MEMLNFKWIKVRYKVVIKMTSALLLFLLSWATLALQEGSLVDSIKQIKPSVVGIAMYAPIQSSSPQLLGTGFVVGNGKYVVTNYHVVSKELDPSIVQNYVALSGTGTTPKLHKMEVLAIDPVHDIAILSINDTLPAVKLASDELANEGVSIFFTGFPIGAILGLYPATHQGIIAAIAPDINPARNADQLTVQMFKRLKAPFFIYQLDATAYPGNSGSPVFEKSTNEVIGIINKVFVSEGKEAALTNPSGISYAVPIRELRKLAKANNIML
jgi:S1-C subfamily serine protease